jgi:molybdenum cofactor cytidylyltransferase
MLRSAIECATQITEDRTIVVLGANAMELSATVGDCSGTLAFNRDWNEGIASSIRLGVGLLPVTCAAVMVLLADQPAVTSNDLKALVSAWSDEPQCMAAAFYKEVVGAPAIFPRRSFGELASLRGDVGARLLLQREGNRLLRVPMPNAGIDVDKPEDLLNLEQVGQWC